MKNTIKLMTVVCMVMMLVISFAGCGEPASLEENLTTDKGDDGRHPPKPHHGLIQWEIDDDAFVHHFDKTIQRDKGIMTITSDKAVQFFANGQVIPLNGGDEPFGDDGVVHQADTVTYEEADNRSMSGNDGKEVDNENELNYVIDIIDNGSSEKDYIVNGTFTSNVASNFDAPIPGNNPKLRLLFDLLKPLPLRRKMPQSGEITININLSNDSVEEQHAGKVIFDGDYTITLEMDGESREIDLKNLPKNHRQRPERKGYK
jgi:hypothetical protein